MARTVTRRHKERAAKANHVARKRDDTLVRRKAATREAGGKKENLSPGEVLALQKSMGNAYVQRLIQREIDGHTGGCGCPSCNGGGGLEAAMASDGRSATVQREPADVQRNGLSADQQALKDQYNALEPDLDQYAARNTKEDSQFKKTLAEMPSKQRALASARGPSGELLPAAVNIIVEAEQHNDVTMHINSSKGRIDVTTPEGKLLGWFKKQKYIGQLKALAATGEYPELMNLPEVSGEKPRASQPATEERTLGGTTFTISFDYSDINLGTRLNHLSEAVKKVAAMGMVVPPMRVNLPKIGRELSIDGDCNLNTLNKSARAVYVAPDFLHISSEIVDNPSKGEYTNLRTGAKEAKFLSSALDPSGIATMVHELGHVMHFKNSPSKYHGLTSTSLKGAGVEKAGAVSGYATGHPREFIAEVFLGLVYGKTFANDILQMYIAMGGAVPAGLDISALAGASRAAEGDPHS